MGQLQIVISRREVHVRVRWTIRKISLAYGRVLAEMAASSSGDDSEDLLPKYGWRVHLDNTFSHKPQPCYIPRWSQIPRLIGLGWRYYPMLWSCLCFFVNRSHRRIVAGELAKCCHVWLSVRSLDFRFMKYATRERKNGRVPFIDPFATNPCRQVYGKSTRRVYIWELCIFSEISHCNKWQKCFWKRLQKLLKYLLNKFFTTFVCVNLRHDCGRSVAKDLSLNLKLIV